MRTRTRVYIGLFFIAILGGLVYYHFFMASSVTWPILPHPSPAPSSGPPAELTFKTTPMIVAFTWIDTSYGGFGTQSDSQLQADMGTLKGLGFTAINSWDLPFDKGTHDDDCASYRTTKLLQIAQQVGLYVIPAFTTWTSTSPMLATHLQKLASFYKGYSNLIGLYFDDWQPPRAPSDEVGFDDFVRQNFNIGRDYSVNYAFFDSYNSGQLKGKSLVSLGSDMYVTSQGAGGWSDPYGTEWLQSLYDKYYSASSSAKYAIGPVFDASGEGNSDLSGSWAAQASFAIQHNMLMYSWYGWKRCSGDQYGTGFGNHQNWWPAIKQVNQQILAFLQG